MMLQEPSMFSVGAPFLKSNWVCRNRSYTGMDPRDRVPFCWGTEFCWRCVSLPNSNEEHSVVSLYTNLYTAAENNGDVFGGPIVFQRMPFQMADSFTLLNVGKGFITYSWSKMLGASSLDYRTHREAGAFFGSSAPESSHCCELPLRWRSHLLRIRGLSPRIPPSSFLPKRCTVDRLMENKCKCRGPETSLRRRVMGPPFCVTDFLLTNAVSLYQLIFLIWFYPHMNKHKPISLKITEGWELAE